MSLLFLFLFFFKLHLQIWTRLSKIEANKTRLSEKFSSKTRPRWDNLQNFVRDWDETESLSTFSLETETRPRLSPISAQIFIVLKAYESLISLGSSSLGSSSFFELISFCDCLNFLCCLPKSSGLIIQKTTIPKNGVEVFQKTIRCSVTVPYKAWQRCQTGTVDTSIHSSIHYSQ